MNSTLSSISAGIDVGGSHISGAIVTIPTALDSQQKIAHQPLDSSANNLSIIKSISSLIKEIVGQVTNPVTVGIAIPGPFNYEKGISEVHGVGGKFGSTFGLHMEEAIRTFTNLPAASRIHFANDAHCFATGAYHLLNLQSKNTICIALGTGIGSALLQNGKPLPVIEGVPSFKGLYCEPFKNSIADDYFSTRWFINEYKSTSNKSIQSVKALAILAGKEKEVKKIFETFGENMASFLAPWLKKYNCDTLVFGGNISKAWHLFGETFSNNLIHSQCDIALVVCDNTEQCIITGAALLATEKENKTINETFLIKDKMTAVNLFRKTTQPLLPLKYNNTQTGYGVFPSFQLSNGKIETGFDTLATQIATQKTIVIDGFGGVLWDKFRIQLNAALSAQGINPLWYDITACLKPEAAIDEMLKESLNGDDPVFGKKFTGELADFFDKEKLSLLKPDATADTCIIYGTGAALSNWNGLLIYLDIPKNEIQYRMRANSISNLGKARVENNNQLYKRLYFADWPVLNKHKEKLLPAIDYIVDEQRINEITWMNGIDFRAALNEMLERPFRARPWFEAGIWGGNWMKEKIKGLVQDEVNYAWSFELITPENGIVLSQNNMLLEVSFDFLLFCNNEKLLGKAAKRFGKEFPIRFDFLDTFNGGNLSIQCHPRPEYIKKNFGENFTQDETYYILDCKPDAKVYLGFQENIDASQFKTALLDSQEKGIELIAEDYVQSFTAHKHDLFLIPNGTVHSSGKNNMVLEISSTPYIFTFKMYDWVRPGLNGQPRPINIEHAFNNLDFERKGDYVQEHLISKPQIINEWAEGRLLKLPTHEEHFYTVDRYEFTGSIQINTLEQCHICMLVEGDKIEVNANGKNNIFYYAETFVIPAAVKSYELKTTKDEKAFVVVAYIKEESC